MHPHGHTSDLVEQGWMSGPFTTVQQCRLALLLIAPEVPFGEHLPAEFQDDLIQSSEYPCKADLSIFPSLQMKKLRPREKCGLVIVAQRGK